MIIPLSQRTTDAPNALPNFRQRVFTNASDFVDRESMQLAGLGKQAAGAVENIALKELSAQAQAERKAREVADNFRVLDATTQLKMHSQNLEKEFQQVTGADAFSQDFLKSVESKYQTRRSEIESKLSTPEQRFKFQQHADTEFLSLRDKAMGHESRQYKAFQDSTLHAAITVATDDIVLNYKDEKAVGKSIADIGKLHTTLAGMYGKSSSFAETQAKEAVGTALVGVSKSLVESNDFAGATAFLDKYADKMPPGDVIKARSQLQNAASEHIGLSIADSVIDQYKPNINPDEYDKVMHVLWDTESGGKHFNNGKITTSKVGARGIGQIMPDTAPEAAKLAGVKFDEELFNRKPTGDPVKDKEAEDYNKKLSAAYFGKQVSTFGGDLRKAFAAYNSGPGNVEKAIKNTPPGKDWLDYLVTNPAAKAETINYVKVNMEKYNSGMKPKRATLAEIQDQAIARAGNDVKAREKAVQETKRKFDVEHDAVVQREDDLLNGMFQTLFKNKGNLNDIPKDQLAQLPADKLKRVESFAEDQAKGTPVKTDWFLYQELMNDPALLTKTNLAAMSDKLGETEMKQLIRDQTERKASKDNKTSFDVSGKDILHQMLGEIGIDPTPKTGDTEGFAVMGRVTSRYKDMIDAEESIKQRKLNRSELADIVTSLFKPVEKKTWMGLSSTTVPKVLVGADTQLVISKYDRDRIEREIKFQNQLARQEAQARGEYVSPEPESITDADIQTVYRLER